jgi:photosystem II stability/assembly factor-like uncharacterized protein
MSCLKSFMLLATLVACSKPGKIDVITSMQWKKVVLPGEGLIVSFYGDIHESMVVSTNLKILKTADGGQTWQTVATNFEANRFIKERDTLFADVHEEKSYYSLDNGDSWHRLSYGRIFSMNRPTQVKTSTNQIYKLEYRSVGEQAYPTIVLSAKHGSTNWKNVFPFNHYLSSIYVDAKDRIYLGGLGAEWKGENRGFVSKEPADDALIYYLDK